MGEPAIDVVKILLWALGLSGTALVAIGWWAFETVIKRFGKQDEALAAIQRMIQTELKELREMHHAIDVRLTKIEVRMNAHNGDV